MFVTALMLRLGEMAFWSCRNDKTAQLDKQLPKGSVGDPELEVRILGVSFQEITQALVEEWKMGDDLKAALAPGHKPSKQTLAVLLVTAQAI